MGSRCGRAAGRDKRFRQAALPNSDQYWSELRTTPSFLAWIASQTGNEIEFLMKCTLPSPNPTFTPAGVHAPALAAAVVHAAAAVEAHALLGRVRDLQAQDRAGLHLVAAVVAALGNIETVQIVRGRVIRLRMTGRGSPCPGPSPRRRGRRPW